MMEFSAEAALFLFFVAMIAGWVDSIAGGGGLLTVPSMLLVGMPPAMALATNKLQSSAGTLTAAIYFVQKGAVNLKEIRWLVLA
ncbi:MAG: putative membrane protein YfcA, partial [Flavobacteriales bacterium]